jgi:hypothetical protein
VFHVLERRSPPIDHSIFRVEADAAREASGGLIQGKADIVLPVSVTGIPDGMEAYSERIEIALRAPDGAAWNSGWDPYNVLHGDNSSTSAVYRLVPGKGGPYWLFAHVDESFLGVHGSEPLHVHATVAFTMLGRPQTKLVSRWGTPLAIAGNGVCEFSKFPSNVSGLCVTPLRKPALTVIRIQPLPSGSPNEAPALDRDPGGNANYGEFGIWRVWQQAWMTVPRGPFAMSVEVRQAVAHFERELDMPGVRLKEYR